jgi:hypothetical protein
VIGEEKLTFGVAKYLQITLLGVIGLQRGGWDLTLMK